MELLIIAALLVGAALAVPRGLLRWSALVGAAALVALLALTRPAPLPALAHYRPADATAAPDATYGSSRVCRSCHPDEYASWHATHHRQMTQAVGPDTVLAAFDGRTLIDGPRTYRVLREGDAFFVEMPRYGTNGLTPAERMRRPVVMSTGSHHMQAYWLPNPALDAPPERAGRAAFDRRCTACHGRDGGAKGELWSLIGGERTPDELDRILADEIHRGLAEGDEAAAVRRFVERIQSAGRLMQFPFVWLVAEGRWVHEEYTFLQPPEPPRAVEPYGDTWSEGCDQCHSVRPSYRWHPDAQAATAAVVELGIACEACHGAGRNHVALHQNPAARYARVFDDAAPADDIVHPAELDHRRASAICAQCHAELVAHDPGARYEPGTRLSLYADVVQYIPKDPPKWLAEVLEHEPTLLDDAFWTDGTIRIAGRNYNAMALTGCFTEGEMSCQTCHSMHDAPPDDQLKGPAVDDSPCVGCHPAIMADLEGHTHHPAASDGSRCYNCHMPHTTVGLLTLMRSHRIDSPDAVRTAWTGRPDACSLCHIDKTLPEIAATLTDWYGHEALPEIADDGGASAVVAWALRGDAVQRATAAWHMAWPPAVAASGSDWQAPYLARLLDDPYAAVRAIAATALRRQPGFGDFEYDYVAPPTARTAAVERAMKRWRSRGAPADRPGALVREGALDWPTLIRLFEARDDTEVRVNE